MHALPTLRIGCALALQAVAQVGQQQEITAQQWREDLKQFATQVPILHKNAFHHISREQFDAAVKDLDSKLDGMDYDHAAIGFTKITAMIGDAHTRTRIPNERQRTYGLRFRIFGDEYRVVQTVEGAKQALGARLVAIDGTQVSAAQEAVFSIEPQDEYPWLRRALSAIDLIVATNLHGLGVVKQRAEATYTFSGDDGKTFTLPFKEMTIGDQRTAKWVSAAPRWVHAGEAEVHKVNDFFTYEYLPKYKTVWCRLRIIRDLGQPCKELFDFIKTNKPEKVIVDLRSNPGGNYFEGLHYLIEPLKALTAVNRKGHLFVMIDALTGSAAIINAVQFHTMTQATLVGRPIGAKPTSYAEAGQTTLKNSGLVIGVSIDYYKFAYDAENVVKPDKDIESTWSDYKLGRDAPLEWVLGYRETQHAA